MPQQAAKEDEHIGLRHLCDWAVFENSLSEEDFCGLFEEKLKAVGLWKYAQVLTLASIKYLGAENRMWAQIDDESVVDDLVEDIMNGENLGKKDDQRFKAGLLISSRGKNGVGKTSMFINLLNRQTK